MVTLGCSRCSRHLEPSQFYSAPRNVFRDDPDLLRKAIAYLEER